VAIALLSSAPILFPRLTRRKQAQLLKMVFAKVIVDREGAVQDVQSNAPFAWREHQLHTMNLDAHK
jgi:hypothetical protein